MGYDTLKYHQVNDGDWFTVANMNSFKMQCCDCSLIHDIKFKRNGNKLMMSLTRNVKETTRVRKENK